MFQSFTGTSRRPRQVNLSGRPSNPFTSTTFGGSQTAVDTAREERARRQHERERIRASSRIQRLWRGHSARRKTFDLWRTIWDDSERNLPNDGTYPSSQASLSQLDRLLLFFSPSSVPEDVQRLNWYGMRQASTADKVPCDGGRWPKAYLKLQKACLKALRLRSSSQDADGYNSTLNVLAFAVRRAEDMTTADAVDYYTTLTNLHSPPADALQHALLAPLTSSKAYAGLAVLLAHPLNKDLLGLLKSQVDNDALVSELTHKLQSPVSMRGRLWLLGNVIFLCGISSLAVTAIVAQLLGSLADDVEFEAAPLNLDNVSFDRDVLSKLSTGVPLNDFLHEQFSLLVKQENIRTLLVRDKTASSAQVMANFALTLLRSFPRKADDIRMWLYLGPKAANDVPATQYFWRAMKSTSVFSTIEKDSRAVVPLIRSSEASAQRDDWTVILVFLELYTFLIKIMDDEEFMGRVSGKRQSAIPIDDVAELVTFLKNLGFTLYFNASDLLNDSLLPNRDVGSLSSHFGGRSVQDTLPESEAKPVTIAGMPGVTVDYIKGLTTGLLRAIYERDSRRHFLPKDHWLMTSRFDMTAFIPGVVQEEESRHVIAEQEEGEQGEESDDDIFASPGRGPISSQRAQEARIRAQRKASRRRYLESIAPRLEILQNMPFFIPFHTRVEIFRQFVLLDQGKRRGGHLDPDTWRANMMFQPGDPGRNMLARHHAEIKRKQEFEDAFAQFYELGADLKEPIQITFLDEFGLQEAGIDGGGVTKEFLTSVINQAFDPNNEGMEKYFIENDAHLLFPNPTALDDARIMLDDTFQTDSKNLFLKELLRKFEFLGRIIGKCLYEGILVDVSFAGFFLKKWALTGGHGNSPGESGYRANINDLREFDEALYKGLLDLKNAPDAADFDLTFTVDDMVGPAEKKQVIERELITNGAETPVTNENRLIYINKMSWYRLQGQSASQTRAFLRGLSSIIQPSWLSMFNQSELQTLIGGAQAGIDVQDLRRNTQYGGVYVIGDDGQEHPSVKMFWNLMESLPDEDRRKVLKFVTSTPRGPLLGFSNLNPKFSIRDSGSDENRFPTTSTCVNLLKLPIYKSREVMRRKLLDAVNSGAGFDLS